MHVAILYFIILFMVALFAASVFSIRSLLARSDYYEQLFIGLRTSSDSYRTVLRELTETNLLYDNDEVKILINETNNFIEFLEAYEWYKEQKEEA